LVIGIWIERAMSNVCREGFFVIPKIITPAFVAEESNLLLKKGRQMLLGHYEFSVEGNDPNVVEDQCDI
jgi:hypothetical protein